MWQASLRFQGKAAIRRRKIGQFAGGRERTGSGPLWGKAGLRGELDFFDSLEKVRGKSLKKGRDRGPRGRGGQVLATKAGAVGIVRNLNRSSERNLERRAQMRKRRSWKRDGHIGKNRVDGYKLQLSGRYNNKDLLLVKTGLKQKAIQTWKGAGKAWPPSTATKAFFHRKVKRKRKKVRGRGEDVALGGSRELIEIGMREKKRMNRGRVILRKKLTPFGGGRENRIKETKGGG